MYVYVCMCMFVRIHMYARARKREGAGDGGRERQIGYELHTLTRNHPELCHTCKQFSINANDCRQWMQVFSKSQILFSTSQYGSTHLLLFMT